MDDTDKLLLEGIYFKRKCMRNALNIYSPAGFLLGTVKERYFKWSADFEIFAANQKILFHARQEKNTNDYSIKKADNELIAKVTKSPSPTGHFWYTITFLRHIPALQKILVLFEVLSSCHQESSSFVSKISNKIIDTICCQLYYDSKIKFCILCVLFPLVIVAYLIFIVMFVAYFVGTLFTLLIAKCYSLYNNSDMDLLCAFTWPCRLCKNNHECLDYCLCCNNDTYCSHLSMGGPYIILLCLVLGVYAFLSLA